MRLTSTITQRIADRLAKEPEWAASPLGEALALTIDTQVISLRVMADYLLLPHKTLYRVLTSVSGQPQMPPKATEVFNKDCKNYQLDLKAAIADGAFEDVSWKAHAGCKPRDDALIVLEKYRFKREEAEQQ